MAYGDKVLTCGRMVKYCLHDRDGVRQYRPAVVVHVFEQLHPPLANLVVFIDGVNDRQEWEESKSLTVWRTSVKHGDAVGEWVWPEELETPHTPPQEE